MLFIMKRNMINLKNVIIIQAKSQNLDLVFHTIYLIPPSLCQGWTEAVDWKVFSQETCIDIQLAQHATQLFLVHSTNYNFSFFFSTSQRVLISVQ